MTDELLGKKQLKQSLYSRLLNTMKIEIATKVGFCLGTLRVQCHYNNIRVCNFGL